MAPYQVKGIRVVTVNVIAAFNAVEDNMTIAGLSDEVIKILKAFCGMRGLKRVSVDGTASTTIGVRRIISSR